jgi:hypothetical protein
MRRILVKKPEEIDHLADLDEGTGIILKCFLKIFEDGDWIYLSLHRVQRHLILNKVKKFRVVRRENFLVSSASTSSSKPV